MVYVMWSIRLKNSKFDTSRIYEAYPTMFTIKLHHGGRFTKLPEMEYVEGEVRYVDLVDIDEFSVHELDAMMAELGYTVPPVIYYHFRIPHEGFPFGLRALGNDEDVLNLANYVGKCKVIDVYTEHGRTNLVTYFMSPKGKPKVIIEEIIEDNDTVVADQSIPEASNVNEEIQEHMALIPYNTLRTWCRRSRGDKPSKGNSSCTKRLCFSELDDRMEDVEVQSQEEGVQMNNLNGSINAGIVEGEPEIGMDAQQQINIAVEADVQGQQQPINKDGQQEVRGQSSQQQFEYEPQIEGQGGAQEEIQSQGQFQGQTSFVQEGLHYEFQDFDPFFGEIGQQSFNMDGFEFTNDKGENEENRDSESGSDFVVDEDNIVSEVDVNMDDFLLNLEGVQENDDADRMQRTLNGDEEPEDMEVIDNEAWDSLTDEDDSLDGRKRRAVLKDAAKMKKCSHGVVYKVSFYVGQKFKTKKELKDKVQLHAIESRRDLRIKKNDSLRLRAVCKRCSTLMNLSTLNEPPTTSKGKGKKVNSDQAKCTWALHASRSNKEEDWYVRTFNRNHTCLQTRKVKACTTTFISKQIMDRVETNPSIPIRALQYQIEKKYELGVSIHKAFRAKAVATKLVIGDYTKQYEILRDYVLELQSTNPNTAVKIDVYSSPNPDAPTRQFRRIYVCLGPLKEGYKAGLRELIGLDGSFMKGPFPGQVLTAVGLDSNNGIYPLAYGIVETENLNSWKWFLKCLREYLDLESNSNYTFISDRQKGLIPALTQVFPNAEHRYCIRHIYENMRKTWKLKEYKEHLWKCASAATIPEFEHCMKDFSTYDKDVCDWLKKIHPKHWARSYFTGRATSDLLLNNLCEVFNNKIIDGRDKPVIGCLEYIREYLMKRICNVMKEMNKCKGLLTPTATSILEENMSKAAKYNARWNGGNKYQVSGAWQDQHVVDVKNNTCSCRKWELTGIPCRHAIATLNEMSRNLEDVGDIYKWVHKVYWLETWQKAYSFKVEPIKGRSMWPKSLCPTLLTPPPHHKQVGRPKKKRKVSADERMSQRESQGASQQQEGVQMLTRKGLIVTCSKCKNKGHNARTCKGQGGGESGSHGGA